MNTTMKKTIKPIFKGLSMVGLCMAFTPLSHAYLIETIEYTQPKELCFEQRASSNDISQFTLDYVFTLPEADIDQEGRIFVAFVFDNEPDKFYLRFVQQDGSFGWRLYNPDVALDDRFVASNLAPVVPLKIVRNPIDLTERGGGGNVFVGYGFKIHGSDTANDIFQEMVSEARYSVIGAVLEPSLEKVYGFSSPTTICVETTSVTKHTPLGIADIN